MITGKVKNRKRDSDGKPLGREHSNPILDTRKYEVEFPGGELAEYSANIIAKNMWSQCDTEGNQYLLMDEIIDHKSNRHAVQKADMYVVKNGRKYLRNDGVSALKELDRYFKMKPGSIGNP